MDLLQGRFAESVMAKLTRQDGGLFPRPREIKFRCNCPDWASMCKHVAAVLYGIGTRLDDDPELLFVLRGVDPLELIAEASTTSQLESALSSSSGVSLDASDLESVFGIDLDDENDSAPAASKPAAKKRRATKKSTKKTATKRTAAKTAASRKTKKASVTKTSRRAISATNGTAAEKSTATKKPKAQKTQAAKKGTTK